MLLDARNHCIALPEAQWLGRHRAGLDSDRGHGRFGRIDCSYSATAWSRLRAPNLFSQTSTINPTTDNFISKHSQQIFTSAQICKHLSEIRNTSPKSQHTSKFESIHGSFVREYLRFAIDQLAINSENVALSLSSKIETNLDSGNH